MKCTVNYRNQGRRTGGLGGGGRVPPTSCRRFKSSEYVRRDELEEKEEALDEHVPDHHGGESTAIVPEYL